MDDDVSQRRRDERGHRITRVGDTAPLGLAPQSAESADPAMLSAHDIMPPGGWPRYFLRGRDPPAMQYRHLDLGARRPAVETGAGLVRIHHPLLARFAHRQETNVRPVGGNDG